MKKLGLFVSIATLALGLTACGKSTVSVELTEVGNQPVNMVKVVQEVTDLGLMDAKAIVDNAPSIVVEGVSKEEAQIIVEKIEEKGGTAVIK